MSAALFWSGGKDSLLALDRAQRAGLEVTHLVNIFDQSSARVRFHGIKKELIGAQAHALGKSLVQRGTAAIEFETTFLRVLEELRKQGHRDIVFGNIHLADVRAWYEERTTKFEFRHHEPLWGDDPVELVEEFIARGHRARITSVYLDHGGRSEWLGREFTLEFLRELDAAAGVDACGERGEYHSLSFAGPLFASEIATREVGRFHSEGHLILDLDLPR
jgi:diphthine-ammonia ligase